MLPGVAPGLRRADAVLPLTELTVQWEERKLITTVRQVCLQKTRGAVRKQVEEEVAELWELRGLCSSASGRLALRGEETGAAKDAGRATFRVQQRPW